MRVPFNGGAAAGPRGTFPWKTSRDGDARRIFPPLDHALVKAIACELVAETKQPLSRQSLADVTARARKVLGKPISRSTVWRILDTDAIKPWRYKYWIFPRDPYFAEKAGPILDLYGHVARPAPGSQGPHPQRRREDQHPGPPPPPSLPASRAGPSGLYRERIQARRCPAISGCMGRVPGVCAGTM